ncbi:DoxX family protein, partial [Streptomyces sp. NRRL S-444]
MAYELRDRAIFRATSTSGTTATHDLGLLVLRLVVGLTMVGHGTQKL